MELENKHLILQTLHRSLAQVIINSECSVEIEQQRVRNAQKILSSFIISFLRSKKEVLVLSRVCTSVFTALKSTIESKYSFRIPDREESRVYGLQNIVTIERVVPVSEQEKLANQRMSLICNVLDEVVNNCMSKIEYLNLVLVCRALFNFFKSRVESTFTMRISSFFLRKYSPQRAIVTHECYLSSIPGTVTHLTTTFWFNRAIHELPPNLTHLKLGWKFNQPVTQLPASLYHLTLGNDFNHTVENLPLGLKVLITGTNFNQSVDGLPPTLTHLTTGDYFNQPVCLLPRTLTHLILGNKFNHPVDLLPPSLKHLTTGKDFDYPVTNLSLALTHIRYSPSSKPYTVEEKYQLSDNCFVLGRLVSNFLSVEQYLQLGLVCVDSCKSIKSVLEHSSTFRIPEDEKVVYYSPTKVIVSSYQSILDLPPTVTHLTTDNNYNQPLDQLPKSLKHLVLGGAFNLPIDNLPTGLLTLSTGRSFNQALDNLPSTLTHLWMCGRFNQRLDCLPPSLKHLKLSWDFDHPIDSLPKTLTHLTLGQKFNKPIDNLPPSLTHLNTGTQFNQPIDNLPHSLTHLSTRDCFNKPVDNLPPNLVHLSFGEHFNQPLNKLPLSVTYLGTGKGFYQSVEDLPLTVTHDDVPNYGCFGYSSYWNQKQRRAKKQAQFRQQQLANAAAKK